jgi:ParB family chromosome partitioning protein
VAARKGGLNMGKGLQNLIPGGNKLTKHENKEDDAISNESDESKENTKSEKAVAVLKKEVSETTQHSTETSENDIQEVKISLVIPNSDQPRKEFDDSSISELAESIKNYGIIQPLIVQKKDKYYEIIAGERRWRAAKLAGLKKLPVIVRNYNAQEVMEIALIENIQREDLNPIEEAAAFKRLIEEFDMKQADLAKRVAKSRTAITNSMRLLKLDERVQNMLINGIITTGHARALLSIEDQDKQFGAAIQIEEKNLSVRETEKLIQRLKKPEKIVETEDTAQIDNIYNSIEEGLKGILGSKVSIKRKKSGKGKIEIEYYSAEEFDRIIDMLHKVKEEND